MNVLIVNGKEEIFFTEGKLNNLIASRTEEIFKDLGYGVMHTTVDKGYDVENEINKILQSDIILYTTPVFWMSVPSILKKYFDDVFTSAQGKFFSDDGRSRDDASKRYASGGLLDGKYYILNTTWNAPENAFKNKDQVFGGRSVDEVFYWLEVLHAFCGIKKLSSFSFYDVVKNPDIENSMKNYEQLLRNVVSELKK